MDLCICVLTTTSKTNNNNNINIFTIFYTNTHNDINSQISERTAILGPSTKIVVWVIHPSTCSMSSL